MKPRLYLKIGILLAEVLFLTFIVMFSFGQLREKDSPAIEMAANPSDDFSQNTAQEMPPTNVPPSHDGDENNRQQPPGENAPDQGTATATPVDCGPPANWTLHQVREGETVISLAQFLGVSSDDLSQANCLGEAGVLTAGMKLFVPYPVPTADVVMQTPTPAESQMPAQPTEVIETSLEAEPTQIAEIEGPETAADTEFVEFDLRAVDQSGEYVSNPGMGWQYEGGSFPITTPAETVAYSQRSLISWKIINPQEGVYNWTPLDNQLNTAVGQGKQFSFRVYTMMGGSWGPHQVPDWVLAKGAQILPSGEPNYANCTYQQEWGNFVNAVISRYDGNSNIAFIDISGYGQFNEWSWNDQTEWDYLWAEQYASGTAGADTMSTIDSYTRRVLADIYIGGSFTGHECVDASSNVQTVNYNYPGFQSTQLVLPYAGIAQSTQYVLTRSQNVGFRFDCMGRSGDDLVEKVGAELNAIYPNAPIIYETCSAGDFNLAEAMYLIENTHPILI
ncbi:MAG TPA: LysM peptidoglycan-binding domain-containing protein, partial [Anaerolineales bacterium]|nr:LysM peptidoglycan-binding domain-containing protein [Anaerolineales bacterium]